MQNIWFSRIFNVGIKFLFLKINTISDATKTNKNNPLRGFLVFNLALGQKIYIPLFEEVQHLEEDVDVDLNLHVPVKKTREQMSYFICLAVDV